MKIIIKMNNITSYEFEISQKIRFDTLVKGIFEQKTFIKPDTSGEMICLNTSNISSIREVK